jgi:hypothetical protein
MSISKILGGTIFWVKILKFFDADPGSEMEKIWILDKHPGSATLEPTLSTEVKGPDRPHNLKILI